MRIMSQIMIFIMVVTTGTGTGSLTSQTLFPVLVGVAGSAAGFGYAHQPGKKGLARETKVQVGQRLSSSIYFYISVLLLPDTVGTLEHNYPIMY